MTFRPAYPDLPPGVEYPEVYRSRMELRENCRENKLLRALTPGTLLIDRGFMPLSRFIRLFEVLDANIRDIYGDDIRLDIERDSQSDWETPQLKGGFGNFRFWITRKETDQEWQARIIGFADPLNTHYVSPASIRDRFTKLRTKLEQDHPNE